MMKTNPFPGMNPWMQSVWHDVHVRLITHLSEAITEKLPDDLVARAEESVTLQSSEDELIISKPDVNVAKSDSWKDGISPAWTPQVDETLANRIASPVIVSLDQESERWVEITDAKGNLITVIEVLSPSNKTKKGRDIFERKLNEFWKRGVSTVEIDLIRGGINAESARPSLQWPEEPFQIIVTRWGNPSEYEVYPCPLREPLPVFLIPLRQQEPDLPFDMQPLINRCYEKGRYWMLDYQRNPSPTLDEDDLKWSRERLGKLEG